MGLKNNYVFKKADSRSGPGLDEIQRSHSFEGDIELQYVRLPNPWASLKQERGKAQVILTSDLKNGNPIGYGSAIYRNNFLNNQKVLIGYLGNLKLKTEYHKKNIPIHRAYEYLFSLRPAEAIPFFYSTILESNKKAIKVLTSNKSFMPQYKQLGIYCTTILAGGIRSKLKRTGFREIQPQEYNAYIHLYNMQAAKYDFSTTLDKHFLSKIMENGSAKAYGFFENDQLLGGCLLIDPDGYKQTIVQAYRGIYKLTGFLNTLARIRKMPLLPEQGDPLKLKYLSYMAVRGENPQVFQQLVSLVRSEYSRKSMIVLGFCERHPFHIVLKTFQGIRYKSRMYLVRPREVLENFPINPERIPHFECVEL